MIRGKEIYKITLDVLDEGAGTIIYNDRTSSDNEFMKNAELMISACDRREVTTIINNRLDIAMIIHADGVCVENQDIPVKACRSIAGQSFVIGSSVILDKKNSNHVNNEADFYLIGPLSMSEKNKQDNLKILNNFVSLSNVPVVVYGNITIDILQLILDCGVTGIVLKPDFAHSENILPELQSYKKTVETYKVNN
jgi:thiamine-phosphate pyrophosphorylase